MVSRWGLWQVITQETGFRITHQPAWSEDYSPAGLVQALLTSLRIHQLAWSQNYSPAGLVWWLLTSVRIIHWLAWFQDYSPAGLVSPVCGLLTSWPGLRISHQLAWSEDYSPAGLVWGLLTSLRIIHQLAWSEDCSPAGLVSGLLTSLMITHQLAWSEDYSPVWGLLTSQLSLRITHQSDDYSPAGLVWKLLTSRSVSSGRHVQRPWLKVLWQRLQGDEGVQRPVGPQVHAEVAHMAGCQEVICGRHTQRGHGRVHSEAVNKPAHSDKRTAWLKAKPLLNPKDARPDLAVYNEAVDQSDTEEHVQQCFASWTSKTKTHPRPVQWHLMQLYTLYTCISCTPCIWSILVLTTIQWHLAHCASSTSTTAVSASWTSCSSFFCV